MPDVFKLGFVKIHVGFSMRRVLPEQLGSTPLSPSARYSESGLLGPINAIKCSEKHPCKDICSCKTVQSCRQPSLCDTLTSDKGRPENCRTYLHVNVLARCANTSAWRRTYACAHS